MIGAAVTWREKLQAAALAAYTVLRGGGQAAVAVKDAATEAAGSVAQTAAAAVATPVVAARDIVADTRRELDDWWAKTSRNLAEGAIMGVLGILGLVVLTMGIVVLLNRLLGDPYGTILVGLLYALALAGLVARRKARARADTRASEADASAAAHGPPEPPPTLLVQASPPPEG